MHNILKIKANAFCSTLLFPELICGNLQNIVFLIQHENEGG